MKHMTLIALSFLGLLGMTAVNAESYFTQRNSSRGEIGLTGEFLLWQPEISGTAYAATNTLTATPFGVTLPNDIEYQAVEFDYKPGFRIGALYSAPCNSWNVELLWTHLNTSGYDSVVATADRFITTLWEQIGAITASEANSHVNVELELVDLNFGKLIDVCGPLSLRPYIGASYYKLNVDNDINYVGTIVTIPAAATFEANLYDHSYGFGLNVGVDGFWDLPCGFGLYAKGAYSLYQAKSNNTILQTTIVPSLSTTLAFNTNNQFSILNQLFKLAVGVSWDYALCLCACPIDVSVFAGYELNYWPNQIELKRGQFSGSETAVIPLDTSGDVAFQGLTTGISLTF